MILLADSEGPDQTAQMRSLIWVFAVRTRLEGTFWLGGLKCFKFNTNKEDFLT